MSYTDLITKENFGIYAQNDEVQLTEEEKNTNPYAKFADFPINLPSEENINALLPGKEVDPSVAIRPADIPQLFAPGYLACENGYCVLPDGYGFSAVRVDLPGVTPEMINFWFPWYNECSAQYKLWFPGKHVGNKGEFHFHSAWENLGWGVKQVVLGGSPPLLPPAFGIDDPTAKDPDYVRFFGGSNGTYASEADPEKDEPEGYCTMVNYFRKKGSGMELRIRAWFGVRFIDGKYLLDDPADDGISLLEKVRLTACHNAWEWAQAATLLPEVYRYAQENGLIQDNGNPF